MDKITVTMTHTEAKQSIEVMASEVKNAEVNGWTRDPPKPEIEAVSEPPKKPKKSNKPA